MIRRQRKATATTMTSLLRCVSLPVLCCIFWLHLIVWTDVCRAQDGSVNAQLNQPAQTITQVVSPNSTVTVTAGVTDAASQTATQTPTAANNNAVDAADAPVPTETIIAPIDFSSQQVPYLLSLPKSEAKINKWKGPTFSACSNEASLNFADAPFRINVSAVYSQFDQYNDSEKDPSGNLNGVLRMVAIGTVGNESHAFATSVDANGNKLGLLSAAGAQTQMLTFEVHQYYTELCQVIFPNGNDTRNPNVIPPSCQYGPGQVAIGFSIPLNATYEAGTLMTQLHVSDASNPAKTLMCIEVPTSTYTPNRWYWRFILWLPIALFITLFFLATFAAVATAETAQRLAYKNRAREGGAPTFVRDKLRPMILSALAGHEMVRSPALLRFVTPGCWDILFHLHFLVALALCHVQWPDFFYPFIRQAAWASLLGNVSIVETSGQSHNLLATNTTLPNGDIGSQMSNSTSNLYMNAQKPNVLLNLGTASTGMERFAASVGISSSSFFGTCLTIWLAIIAAVLVVSAISWFIDASFETKHKRQRKREEESGEIILSDIQQKGMLSGGYSRQVRPFESPLTPFSTTPQAMGEKSAPTRVARVRLGYHLLALHGNLVRALVLFHLPITIFSVFQFAEREQHSTVSVVLAALSFVVFSVGFPVYIIRCIARTTRERLYEDANTLLALGPVYHMYAPGSQLFYIVTFIHSLGIGVAVGAGQSSGMAQMVVFLTLEVVAALASSLWLPWGDGAMMGPLNFLNGVIRIITTVLVLLLTSTVGFTYEAQGWLVYVILLLQGIFFAGALFVVLVKLTEAVVRIIWRVRFDERVSGRTAGLGGAIRKIRRRKMKNRRAAINATTQHSPSASVKLARSPSQPMGPKAHSRNVSSASTMLAFDKYSATPHSADLNRLGYSDYMDRGNRPRSIGSDLDYFTSQGMPGSANGRPESHSPTYPVNGGGRYRRDTDESGAIMAALPPVTPTSELTSFVRINGGRATDNRPYSTVNDGARAHGRRPQSFSGIVGDWETGQRQAQPANIQQTGAYEQRPHRTHATSNEWSSTQAAALTAHQTLIGLERRNTTAREKSEQRGFVNELRSRLGFFGSARKGVDGDDGDSVWSDEEEGVGTWNSQQVAERRVPWTGAVKMKEGLASIRNTLFGSSSAINKGGHVPIRTMDEEESADQSPKGFEVVRKPKAGQLATQAPQRTSPPQADTSHQHDNTSARQHFDRTPVDSTPSNERSLRASDFYQTSNVVVPAAVSSSSSKTSASPTVARDSDRRSPLHFYHPQSSLGLLGADVQRIESDTGHDPAQDDEATRRQREAQFWLPPLDVRTEREVAAAAANLPAQDQPGTARQTSSVSSSSLG